MTQLDLFRNPFKVGTQNWRLLERLKMGPLTNTQIVRDMNIYNSTGRTSDLRAKGFNVEGRQIRDGLWEYELK